MLGSFVMWVMQLCNTCFCMMQMETDSFAFSFDVIRLTVVYACTMMSWLLQHLCMFLWLMFCNEPSVAHYLIFKYQC